MSLPGALTHAWMPSSPCTDSCMPNNAPTVGRMMIAVRIGLGVIAFGFLPVLVVLGVPFPRVRRELTRVGARILLFAIGIDLDVVDRRSDRERSRTESGALSVAGHISWTDVVVLTAVQPANFVARSDLIDWPILGALARAMKVVPIDRSRLRTLPDVIDEVTRRVRAGSTVVVFPEATTWCGRAYGTLRPALFQAAIDSETWVQPIRLRYVDRSGEQTTSACFVGDESIGQSIARIVRLRGLRARVEYTTPEAPGCNRFDLARRCETAIRSGDDFDPTAHEISTTPSVARLGSTRTAA